MRFEDILLWIWQLPQNLVGLIMMLFLRPVELVRDTGYAKVYRSRRMSGGISQADDDKTIKHEGIGHPRQSRMLGPLYLPVIGLPSLVHAWLNGVIGCCDRHPESYYHFWTEKWANRLGGVTR